MDPNEDTLPTSCDQSLEASPGCNLRVNGRDELIQKRIERSSTVPTEEQQQECSSNDGEEDIFGCDGSQECSWELNNDTTSVKTIDNVFAMMDVTSFIENGSSISTKSRNARAQFIQEFQDFDYKRYYKTICRKQKSSHPLLCLKDQNKITPDIRKVSLDWLFDIGYRNNLPGDVIHLAINILDRYTKTQERRQIDEAQYEFIGVTSLLIARQHLMDDTQNYVESHLAFCSDRYTKSQLLALGIHILNSLSSGPQVPTAYDFLDFYIIYGNITGVSLFGFHRRYLDAPVDMRTIMQKVYFLARVLLDIGVTDYNFAQYLPSIAAEATLCVAVQLVNLQTSIRFVDCSRPIKRQKVLAHGQRRSREVRKRIAKCANLLLNTIRHEPNMCLLLSEIRVLTEAFPDEKEHEHCFCH